jgi:hypothetical protein
MIQRRAFLRSVAVAAACATAGPAFRPAARAAGGRAGAKGMPDCAGFARLKGQKFRVSGDDATPQWLELDQVLDTSCDSRVQSVSLRFSGPAEQRLSERLYRFSHEACGSFDFFISPGAPKADRCTYRAIVCRLA